MRGRDDRLGTASGGVSGTVGAPTDNVSRPTHLTAGQIKSAMGNLEKICTNDKVEFRVVVAGLAMTPRDSGSQPAACVKSRKAKFSNSCGALCGVGAHDGCGCSSANVDEKWPCQIGISANHLPRRWPSDDGHSWTLAPGMGPAVGLSNL